VQLLFPSHLATISSTPDEPCKGMPSNHLSHDELMAEGAMDVLADAAYLCSVRDFGQE